MSKIIFISGFLCTIAALAAVSADSSEKESTNKNVQSKLTGIVTVDGMPAIGRVFVHIDENQFIGCHIDDDGRYLILHSLHGKFRVTVEGSNVPKRFASMDNALQVEMAEGERANNLELETNMKPSTGFNSDDNLNLLPDCSDLQIGPGT